MSVSTSHVEEQGLSTASASSSRLRNFSVRVVEQVVFIGALLLAWDLISGPVVHQFFAGKPLRVMRYLVEWVTTGLLWPHLLSTLTASIVGFVLGAAIGVLLGVILGSSATWYKVMEPFVNAFHTIPKIAFAPPLVIIFGIGLTPKVLLAASIVFFFVFMSTITGFREVDYRLVHQVTLMGGGRSAVATKVFLPSVAVSVAHGLRMGFPYALHGAIIGELIAANRGLGFLLQRARGTYNLNEMYAALVIVMATGVAFNYAITVLERHLPGGPAHD